MKTRDRYLPTKNQLADLQLRPVSNFFSSQFVLLWKIIMANTILRTFILYKHSKTIGFLLNLIIQQKSYAPPTPLFFLGYIAKKKEERPLQFFNPTFLWAQLSAINTCLSFFSQMRDAKIDWQYWNGPISLRQSVGRNASLVRTPNILKVKCLWPGKKTQSMHPYLRPIYSNLKWMKLCQKTRI